MSTTRTNIPTPNFIDPVAVVRLADRVSGRINRDGDPAYDQSRSFWNWMIDRRPVVIVQPADSSDVKRALLCAQEHGLSLTIKSGGHNVAGYSADDMLAGRDRIRAGYGGNWDRLRQVKQRYDPTNVFSANNNIPPA